MDFKALFEPKSMAVIGVSLNNDRNPANVIFNKNSLRHPVRVFAVNPRGGILQRQRVFSKVSEIPQKTDLAVIAARAENCPVILSECIEAGIGGAIVVSGGFAETGRKDLQDSLASIAREAHFPLIGPNCLGIYSPSFVDTFFLPVQNGAASVVPFSIISCRHVHQASFSTYLFQRAEGNPAASKANYLPVILLHD